MRRKVSKNMLNFWFHYYGKDAYDFDELEEFNRIVDQVGPEKLFNSIVVNFVINESLDPTFYLYMIRQNSLEEFLRCSEGVEKEIKSEKEGRIQFIKLWVNLYDEIEKDYLNSRR